MKRSLRDYFVTLIVSALILAVAAFFLIEVAEGLMDDVLDKIGAGVEQTETVTGEEDGSHANNVVGNQNADTTTFLILGLDQKNQNADAIFLVGINTAKKQAAVSLIPSNTLVTEGAQKYKLGELYPQKGISYMKEFVARETGISVDFYAAMSMSAVENMIDFLGGMTYDVPEDMYYFDPSQNLHINLQAGLQTLNGGQVLQLLAFRDYEWGVEVREDTQLEFVRTFCADFLKPSYLPAAKAMMYNVFYNVLSDFQSSDLDTLGSVIFGFEGYSQSYIRIPGELSGDFYHLNSSRAKTLFQEYR